MHDYSVTLTCSDLNESFPQQYNFERIIFTLLTSWTKYPKGETALPSCYWGTPLLQTFSWKYQIKLSPTLSYQKEGKKRVFNTKRQYSFATVYSAVRIFLSEKSKGSINLSRFLMVFYNHFVQNLWAVKYLSLHRSTRKIQLNALCENPTDIAVKKTAGAQLYLYDTLDILKSWRILSVHFLLLQLQ